MLRNPFTPAEIASSPDDFFGREKELTEAKRALSKGSVSIQGQIGIGKSSLLARTRLEMEGFGTEHTATSIFAVGDKDITNADQLARTLLLDEFLRIRLMMDGAVEEEQGSRIEDRLLLSSWTLPDLEETDDEELERY
jgi:hypothetical protein